MGLRKKSEIGNCKRKEEECIILMLLVELMIHQTRPYPKITNEFHPNTKNYKLKEKSQFNWSKNITRICSNKRKEKKKKKFMAHSLTPNAFIFIMWLSKKKLIECVTNKKIESNKIIIKIVLWRKCVEWSTDFIFIHLFMRKWI